jgi:CRP-like cAMP-binding protein
MNLTWHIGGRPAPASSWGPSSGIRRRTSSTRGRKPVIGAAVTAALHRGLTDHRDIAAETGLSQRQVSSALHSMQRGGYVRAVVLKTGLKWSLS